MEMILNPFLQHFRLVKRHWSKCIGRSLPSLWNKNYRLQRYPHVCDIYSLTRTLHACKNDVYIVCVWIAFAAFQFLLFPFFFFFFSRIFSPLAVTVYVRYMNSSSNFWPVFCEQYIRALFTDPQISFFINFFIKNGSHNIIYTFKNYFATVISAISFQFQQNKSYPNRLIEYLYLV